MFDGIIKIIHELCGVPSRKRLNKAGQTATIRYWSAHRTCAHLHRIGNDLNPLYRMCFTGNETVEHTLCECESLTISWGRIFIKTFGELQQLSHGPVDLFRWFVTEIGLAGKLLTGKHNRS